MSRTVDPPDADARTASEPQERTAARVRRVVALATAAMLVLSWPLWAGEAGFPRVPFVGGLRAFSGAGDRAAAAALVAATLATGLARRWRAWFAVSLGLLVWLVLNDQHRFQPWAYQFAMSGLFLAARPGGKGVRYARWWFVALYAHSGLSKLDVSFCDELGPVFLRTALAPLGVDPGGWPRVARVAGSLAMPVGELAVAAALAVPAFRRAGRLGAVAMHAALIGILGPLGLRHSTIVLVWNAAMAAEVWVAFGPVPAAAARGSSGRLPWPVELAFWAGVVLPLGERWGAFDAWPSHALYASHVERLIVELHEGEVDDWPAEVRRHVATAGQGPWRRLDLTGWSRAVRGTPTYPQNRAGLGLAEALAARYGGRLVRVVALGPADRGTGRRRRAEAIGTAAIRALGDGFLLNAHPARAADGPRRGAAAGTGRHGG